jgi:antitoxin component YwqK of YwqJK toxin-antitoxin module
MEEGNYVQGNKNGWWKYYNFKGELIRDEVVVNSETK